MSRAASSKRNYRWGRGHVSREEQRFLLHCTLQELLTVEREEKDYALSKKVADITPTDRYADAFIQPPRLESNSAYYEDGKVPVTLTTILNKCEKGKYENVEMFEQDFEEMLSMSKSSLHVSTRALKDVKVMEELFVNAQSNAVAALNTDCDMHLTQNTDVESQIGAAEVVAVGEPLLSALCDAKAKRSRKLVDMFMKLPSRRQLKDYYEVIKKPMDLAIVREKLIGHEYTNFKQLDADIRLVFNNATKFNETGSAIHKGATEMLKLYTQLKKETFGLTLEPPETPREEVSPVSFKALKKLAKNRAQIYATANTPVERSPTPPPPEPQSAARTKSGAHRTAAKVSTKQSTKHSSKQDNSSGQDTQPSTPEPKGVDKPPKESKKTKNTKDLPISVARDMDAVLGFAYPNTFVGKAKLTVAKGDELMARIRACKNGPRDVCEAFQLLPDPTEYADYYEVIADPMDLATMQAKLDHLRADMLAGKATPKGQSDVGTYISIFDMIDDVDVMAKNAMHYNMPESTVYEDAKTLHTKVLLPFDLECTQEKSCYVMYEALTNQTVNLADFGEEVEDTDEDVADYLITNFAILPTKRELPLYYKVIKQPMDFYKIAIGLCNGAYARSDGVALFAQHIQLVVDNCQSFNEDSSLFSRLSVELQKQFAVIKTRANKRKPKVKPVETPSKVSAVEAPVSKKRKRMKSEVPGVLIPLSTEAPTAIVDTDTADTGAVKRPKISGPGKDDEKSVEASSDVIPMEDVISGGNDVLTMVEKPSEPVVVGTGSADTTMPDAPDIVAPQPAATTVVEDKPSLREKPQKPNSIAKESSTQPDIAPSADATSTQDVMPKTQITTRAKSPKKGSATPEKPQPEKPVRLEKTPNLPPQVQDKPAKEKKEKSATAEEMDGSKKAKKDKTSTDIPPERMTAELVRQTGLKIWKSMVRATHKQDAHTLSDLFMDLPSGEDFPDYYEAIASPICLNGIRNSLIGVSGMTAYKALQEMLVDVAKMRDNAKIYNEAGSMVCEDADALYAIAESRVKQSLKKCDDDRRKSIQAKAEADRANDERTATLSSDAKTHSEEVAPAAPVVALPPAPIIDYTPPLTDEEMIQGVIKSLTRMLNQFTIDGVRIASITDLPRLTRGSIKHPITFKELRDGDYVSLQPFVADLSLWVSNALAFYAEGSENYMCTLRLHQYFLKKYLQLVHTAIPDAYLQAPKDYARVCVELFLRQHDDQSVLRKPTVDPPEKSLCANELGGYRVGDYVLLESGWKKRPHVILIHKVFSTKTKEQWVYGERLLHPEDTVHDFDRQFMRNELLLGGAKRSYLIGDIMGKCAVMHVTTFMKKLPLGVKEEDVWVVKWAYDTKSKRFRLADSLPRVTTSNTSGGYRLEPRPAIVKMPKADKPSIYREGWQHGIDFGLNARLRQQPASAEADGRTYYESFCWQNLNLQLGDAVYLQSDRDEPYLMLIEHMYTIDHTKKDAHGEEPDVLEWIEGKWLVPASETFHVPTRSFYARERLICKRGEANPMGAIIGRCAVLPMRDYVKGRPFGIREEDVYVTENLYDERAKRIEKTNLKTLPSVLVRTDEQLLATLCFVPLPEPLASVPKVPSPLSTAPPISTAPAPAEVATPSDDPQTATATRSPPKPSKPEAAVIPEEPVGRVYKMAEGKTFVHSKTGYTMFFAEEKKKFDAEPTKFSVPEFSTMVSTKWKDLARAEKDVYTKQAAAENTRLANVQYIEYDESDLPKLPPDQDVLTCRWEMGEARGNTCNRLFKCEDGLARHIMADHFGDSSPHPCRWLDCTRNIRNKMFDRKGKLTAHIRNQHLRRSNWPAALFRSLHSRNAIVYEHAPPAPPLHVIPNRPFVAAPVLSEQLIQSQGRVLFPPHPTEEMFMPPGIDFFTQVRVRMEEGLLDPIGYYKLLSSAVDRSAAVISVLDPDNSLGSSLGIARLGADPKGDSSQPPREGQAKSTSPPAQTHRQTQTQIHPHAHAQAHAQGDQSTRMSCEAGTHGAPSTQQGHMHQHMHADTGAAHAMEVDDPNMDLYAPAARLSPRRLRAEQAGVWRPTHNAEHVLQTYALKHTAEYILFKQGYRATGMNPRAGATSRMSGKGAEGNAQQNETASGGVESTNSRTDSLRIGMDGERADTGTTQTEKTVLNALDLLCKGLGVAYV